MKTAFTPRKTATRFTSRRQAAKLSLAAAVAAVLASHSAFATSDAWDGSTSALWSLNTNWLTDVAAPGTGETATFNAASGFTTIDLTGGVTIGSIVFDTASAAAYTIGSGAVNSQTLSLDNGGAITMNSSVVNNELFNAALLLGTTATTQTFTLTNASTTNSLTVAGGITGFAGAGVRTLAIAGAGNTTLSGIIGNGTTGTVGLIKSGNGTLTLSGANAFTGGIRITAGTVNVTTAAGLGTGTGSTGQVVVSSGANLNFGTSALTYANNIAGVGTINANTLGTAGATTILSGNLSGFTGTLNIGTGGGKLQLTSASGNQISSSATINVLNGGTLFVSNLFTYGSSLFLNGGTTGEAFGQFRIEAGAVWTGAVTLNANTTIGTNATVGTIAGNIGGSGFGFTKQGGNTLILTGTNTYTGLTGVTAGIMQLGNGGTTGSLSTASAITLTGANLTINRSNAVAQGTDFSGAAITGTGSFTQGGTGTTTLSAANTYTGVTAVNRGTLKLDFAAAGAPTINIINNAANSSALTLAHGTLNLTGKASTANTQRFNNLTLNAGASAIQLNADVTANPLLLTLGTITRNTGGTVDFTLPIGAQSASNGIVTTSANANGILGAFTVGGTDWAASSAGNIVGFSTVGAYTLSSAAGATAANYTNFNIDVDSSQAPAALITPNSLRFSTAAANTLTLTGATNTITSGGILINSSVGSNLSTITGGTLLGANTKDLAIYQNNTSGGLTIGSIIANNTGATGLTKSGAGVLTLTGVNTYTGATTLNAGTLNINNNAAIGNVATGNLVILGGTLDNTSAGAVVTTAVKAQNWNGDFTFTGTQNLSFNNGNATVGGPTGTRTVTISAGTLALGNIGSALGYDLTKAGAGTLSLSGNSTINGVLNVAGGKLLTTQDLTVNGLSGSGTIELGGASNKWLFAGRAGGDSTFSGTITSPLARLGLRKQGGGTLTLSGSNTLGDSLTIEAGTLRITGTTNYVGGGDVTVGSATNVNGVLRVDGGTLSAPSNLMAIATAGNGIGFVNLTSGAISLGTEFRLATGGVTSFGAFTMSGGTLSAGSWFMVGRTGTGILNLAGGSITQTGTQPYVHSQDNAAAFGVTNVAGGTLNVNTTGNGLHVAALGSGILNVTSGAVNIPTAPNGLNLTSGVGTGIANLNGGIVTANLVTKTGGGTGTLNFNGGTLRPAGNNASFMTGLSNAYVYSGGATIDTNGFNITIAQSIVAPTGNGVGGIASFTGGAGYIDTPLVTVQGDGTGATAVATVAGGVVTGITITNPGVGYTTAPTFTVFGGGATIPATITGAAPTANTSGGLTKSGAGILTLNSAHTYTGATIVSGGTLRLNGGGDINASGGIIVVGSGAKLVQDSFVTMTAPVTLTNGTLDGTTTVDNVTVLSGAGNIIANGSGTPGAPLTINTLNFDDAATLNLNVASTSPVLLTTSLNTGAVNTVPGRITINATNVSWLPGDYNLIGYSTLGGVGFSEFLKGTITGLSGRQTATLLDQPGFVALTIAGDNPVWTGIVSGNWTLNAITPVPPDTNWKLITAGTPTDFLVNDVVLFDDTAAGTTTVDIADANVSPLSTNFNNTGLSYTLTSTGGFGIATGNVAITGGGVVTINNANTYSGGTALTLGTLNINNASAIGTGALTIAAGATIDNTSGSAKTLTTNNVQNWNGDFVFAGSNDLNLGTGAVALPATRTVTTNGTATLTVGGVIGGLGFGLIKSGPGTLALTGASTYTGETTVSGGAINLTGTINAANTANVGQVTVGTAGDDAVLRISGGTLNATKTGAPSVAVGNFTGGSGAIIVDSGSLLATSELQMGTVAGGYGALTINGGAVSFGNWVSVGRAGNGVLNVNGGTLTVSTQFLTLASFGGASGVVTLTGSSVTNLTGTTGIIVGEGGTGVLNVSGTAALNVSGANGVEIARTGTGIANLNGGTVTTPIVKKGTGTGILNFNGGTLKASAAAATFMNGLTNAYIYSGGATIDSGTFAVTVNQPLLAPTGNGVSATGLVISGAGYISAPIVQISGDGFGATAVANVDSGGNLTGITITNPGTGYTTSPTFALVGGGFSNTGSISGLAALVPNVGGGLTKTGSGSLTLTGTSTYTGATLVSAGTLLLSGSGEINGSSVIAISGAGAKMVQASAVAVSPAVMLGNGTLDGTTTLNNVTVASSAGNIIANGNGTTGALTIGTLTFNDAATLNLSVASTSPVLITTALTTGAVNAAGLITVNASNAAWANGTVYNLISYSGAIGGIGFSEFLKGTISNLTLRQSATLTNPAGFVALSVAGDTPVWSGANGGIWTTAATNNNAAPNNWALKTGQTGTNFWITDNVEFNDTYDLGGGPLAPATTTVDIQSANVSPSSAVFNNTAGVPYTITSSGGFGIATGFVAINGAGSVTITNANTYTGGTTLNAGTLNINNASAIGSGALTITGGTIDNTSGGVTLTTNNAQNWNGNFIFAGTNALNLGTGAVTLSATRTVTTNGAAALTVGGVISGVGFGLTKEGPGTLTLSGASTYTGGTIVNNGTLALSAGGATGRIRGVLTINSGATVLTSATDAIGYSAGLRVDTVNINGGTFHNTAGNQAFSTNFFLTAGTVTSTGGAINFDTGFGVASLASATTSLFSAPISIRGTSLVVTTALGTTPSGIDLNISGVIFGGGALGFTKAGPGTLQLSGANTYTGPTTIAQGTLSASNIVVAGNSNLGNAATAVVLGDATNEGTLAYTGNTATYIRGFTLAAGGGEIDTTAAGQLLTIGTVGITSASNGNLTIGGAGNTSVVAGIQTGTGTVTKEGTGTVTLAGTQSYASLTTSGGITNVNTAIGTGASTVTANAATNFYASQTLASLTIGAGAEVTFGDGLPFAGGPDKFGAPALVPEPGSLGLLLTGSLGLLGRRRRRA